jgi:hypothetical protein
LFVHFVACLIIESGQPAASITLVNVVDSIATNAKHYIFDVIVVIIIDQYWHFFPIREI